MLWVEASIEMRTHYRPAHLAKWLSHCDIGAGLLELPHPCSMVFVFVGFFLFNDALNTFYLRLYGVRHMVKDHADSEKGNPLPPHRLLLSINSKGSFICTIPQTG